MWWKLLGFAAFLAAVAALTWAVTALAVTAALEAAPLPAARPSPRDVSALLEEARSIVRDAAGGQQ